MEMAAAFSPRRAQIFSSSSGREVGEGADGAGELSDPHVFGGRDEARDVALRLRVPVGDFEAEGDGLGVDAVSAADHGRVFEFPGAALRGLRKGAARSCAMMSRGLRISRACAVSTTSLEVSP